MKGVTQQRWAGLPKGSDIRKVSMKERRKRAHAALESGQFTVNEIARICGIPAGSVDFWHKKMGLDRRKAG